MTKEKHEGITVDGVALETVIEEQERDEIDEVRMSEIGRNGKGAFYFHPTGKFVANTSGARTQQGEQIHSPEVIAHLNYLNQKGGIEAVHEFLNKPELPQGSIESALKDADEKVRYFAKEAERFQLESQKWIEVRNRLLQAKDILMGKITIDSSSKNGHNLQKASVGRLHRDYPALVKDILSTQRTMSKNEFYRQIETRAGITKQNLYNVVATMKRKKVIEDVDGLIALVENV